MATNNKKGKASLNGEVRIIAGKFKGRKLPVLNVAGLRPTASRVRETVFNWLQTDIIEANCLDVFTGSGSLGFEAISRGSKSVTMLEVDANNAIVLKQNKAKLQINSLNILEVNALHFLQYNHKQEVFNIVFIDPPFYQNLMQPTIDLLFGNDWLADKSSILYLEQEKSIDWPILPSGWQCYREKTSSQVRFGLFKYLIEQS